MLITASDCAAKASFSSIQPMSSSCRPALAQRARNRLDRADAHDVRRHALDREADEARQRLQAELLDGLLAGQDQAPAPSLVCELLPAVTLPLAANTGFNLASASSEVSARGAFVEVDGARFDHRVSPLARSGVRSIDLDRRHLVAELAGLHAP